MKAGHFLTAALGSEQVWGMTAEGLEALQSAAQHGALPTAPDSAQAPGGGAAAALGVNAEDAQSAYAAMLAGEGYAAYLTTLLKDTMPNGKSIALVNFAGTVISRAPAWAASYGYLSPQLFASTMTALADNASIGAVVIVMDCNGGTVTGTADAAEAVAYAAKKKKVYTVAADMCLSAAFWIASQSSVIIASPTALVGSIGVITSHADYSAMLANAGIVVTFIRSVVNKARGQAYEPLSAEALAERQGMVNAMHSRFTDAVQKGRRLSKSKVAAWTNDPVQSVWVGSEAVAAGLADREASLSTLLAELTGKQAPPQPAPAPEQRQPSDGEGEEDAASPVTPPTAQAQAQAEVTPLAFNAGQSYSFAVPSGKALSLLDSLGVTVAQACENLLSYTAEQTGVYRLSVADAGPAGAALSSVQTTEDRNVSTGGNTKTGQMEAGSMDIKAILAKVNAGQAITAEEQSALTAHLDQQRAASPSASVDHSKLDPAVSKALTDSQSRAERAESDLAARVEADAVQAAESRAVELGQPKAFGATYRKVSEALKGDAAALAAYEQSITATAAQANLSAEIGSAMKPAAAESTGNLEQQLSAKAQVKIADSKNTLSYKDACEAVFKEDRGFAVRYAQGR